MSCYPRSELPLTSISKPPTESPIIKSDIGSALPVVRPPTGSFPFLADGHNFAPKMQDIASALYGLPYGSPPFYHGLPASNIDPAMLYGSMNRTDLKDLPNNWRNPPLMPFDPSLVSLLYSGGFSPLLADGVRGRKNATRETTSVLKVWLDKHRKNPYPTKSEKFLLAVSAKMTLTQVSTWFANARRRLKKENKMTWSPRNCGGDEKDSGDENTEHGYHVSPSGLDMAIESQKLASSKSQSTSPQITDGIPPSGDMSHQQLQHLLQLLPPHLRTSEALKQVQEQIQWRSRWAAAAATNSEIRSPDQPQPFVSSLKMSTAGENIKNHEQRRSSVGSPSTSSYDGSPSPFHRHSHPSWMPSSGPDQATAVSRSSASVSPSATKHSDDSNESNRSRAKSTDYHKVKPAIWSPANMVVEKPVQNNNASVNRPMGLSPETTMKAALENSMKLPLTSTSCSMESASSSRLGLAESKVSSTETPSFPLHPSMAQAYLREYQRQLASHQQSLQNQHGLSPMMMPLAMDKNQNFVQRQILEQLQRNQQFLNPAQMMFSKNTDDKDLRREVSKETENSNADAPMNLSKTSRHQDESLSPNMKENSSSESKSESGSASPV